MHVGNFAYVSFGHAIENGQVMASVVSGNVLNIAYSCMNSKPGRHIGLHTKVMWPTALFLKTKHVCVRHFASWPTGQHNAVA